MKKLIIIAFAATGILVSSCHGSDKKTDRVSDTSAAKGSGGPADSTKTISTSTAPGGNAPSDTSTTDKASTGDSSVHPLH